MRVFSVGNKVRVQLPSGEWEEVGQPLAGIFWALVISIPFWATVIYLVW
jgi:hypothetical protein